MFAETAAQPSTIGLPDCKPLHRTVIPLGSFLAAPLLHKQMFRFRWMRSSMQYPFTSACHEMSCKRVSITVCPTQSAWHVSTYNFTIRMYLFIVLLYDISHHCDLQPRPHMSPIIKCPSRPIPYIFLKMLGFISTHPFSQKSHLEKEPTEADLWGL